MKIDVCDVQIDSVSYGGAIEKIDEFVQSGNPHLVVTPYSELIVFASRDPEYKKILNQADLSLPDGIGILWAAYYLSSINHHLLTSLAAIVLNPAKIRTIIKEQVTGSRLIYDLAKLAQEKNYSLALVGGSRGVAEKAAEKLKIKNEKLKISFVKSGMAFDDALVKEIAASNSDILCIAYSPPKQEMWLAQNLKNLNVKAAMGLGGTLDYLAGTRLQPPKLFHYLGLEWFYRLLTQPWRIKRIWNAVPVFVWKVYRYKVKSQKLKVMEIRTRYAPSPTGFLHVGGLRTALYNFLWARRNNGKYILRIEDTDQARTVPGALENILQTFSEFNLNPDEGPYWENGIKERGEFGPYFQSKRLDLYKKYAQELIDKKAAYYCFCTEERLQQLRKSQEAQKIPPKYDKLCLKLSAQKIAEKLSQKMPHTIRLSVPADQTIRFTDVVHGEITISSNEVDDQVLLKSDSHPTYHLANVVDDHLMQITHVIRGDEWIPSTPKHILLYSAFGWESPQFVHLPLLLSKSRKKLSKREGDTAVKDFLDQGYLPEALLNFVSLLGWNPKTEEEIFNLRELVQQFELAKLNKAGAVFDLEKLDWINGLYIRRLKIEELFARIVPYLVKAGIEYHKYPKEFVEKILLLEQDRLRKLSEIGERVKYFFQDPVYDPKLLLWKNSSKETIMRNLESLSGFLQTLNISDFKKEQIEEKIKKFIADKGMNTGEVLWPLRVVLTGLEASPGPFEIMDVFSILPNGKEIILKRINKAVELLF